MWKELLIYVGYVVLAGVLLAIFKKFIIDRLSKYFDGLDSTLIELNKTIQLLILDQTKIHGEQDKEIALIREELSTNKSIRNVHREDIDELFNITEAHKIDIELLKQGKEDK
jgi:hypothetical protein